MKILEGVSRKQDEVLSNRIREKTKILEEHTQELNAAHNHVWCEYKTAISNIQEWMRKHDESNQDAYEKQVLLKQQMESRAQKREELAKRKEEIIIAAEIEVMEKFKVFQERKLDALSKYLNENL